MARAGDYGAQCGKIAACRVLNRMFVNMTLTDKVAFVRRLRPNSCQPPFNRRATLPPGNCRPDQILLYPAGQHHCLVGPLPSSKLHPRIGPGMLRQEKTAAGRLWFLLLPGRWITGKDPKI